MWPSVGYIEELCVLKQTISLPSNLEYKSMYHSLHRLTSLSIRDCDLIETHMIHLSKLIPCMTYLKKLDIGLNTSISEDGFVKIKPLPL